MPRWWVHKNRPGFIQPGSPEHSKVISPSKVASICGVSRWQSAFSLWHEMRGLLDPEPSKDIYDVGHAMELAMAELWKIRHPGWKLSPSEVQYHTDEFSFPAMATLDRRATRGRRQHAVEFKIARDTAAWGDVDLTGDSAPADYVLQCMAQQLFSGLTDPADLCVLGPFYKERLYTVDFDENIANWMVGECSRFYDSLDSEDPPPLDDSVSCYQAVKQLHPAIDGTEVEVPTDLITQIYALREEIGPLTAKERGLKTELLDLMGNAQKAVVNGEAVARRQRGRGDSITLVVL